MPLHRVTQKSFPWVCQKGTTQVTSRWKLIILRGSSNSTQAAVAACPALATYWKTASKEDNSFLNLVLVCSEEEVRARRSFHVVDADFYQLREPI